MKKDNKFINNLLKQMTQEEKIGQLYQTFYYGGLTTGPEFENEDVIKEKLGENIYVYESMQKIYNYFVLQDILQGEKYISNAFVKKYETIQP